jgi:polyisoprenoid-binding protein YceI
MFKKTLALILAVVMVSATAGAQTWSIDKPHSSLSFSVRHMVISKTTGKFGDFDGVLNFDGENLAAGSVTVTAQMASVDTDDQKRDEHLRSADFFDVEKFPTMKFESKEVVPGEDDQFKLIGDLTIKGVTKEVTFDGVFNGVMEDPWGNTRAGFSAETTIDRQEFDITWNKTLDAGGLVVGDDVDIEVEMEFVQQK